jgi:hypothetical protein
MRDEQRGRLTTASNIHSGRGHSGEVSGRARSHVPLACGDSNENPHGPGDLTVGVVVP